MGHPKLECCLRKTFNDIYNNPWPRDHYDPRKTCLSQLATKTITKCRSNWFVNDIWVSSRLRSRFSFKRGQETTWTIWEMCPSLNEYECLNVKFHPLWNCSRFHCVVCLMGPISLIIIACRHHLVLTFFAPDFLLAANISFVCGRSRLFTATGEVANKKLRKQVGVAQ